HLRKLVGLTRLGLDLGCDYEHRPPPAASSACCARNAKKVLACWEPFNSRSFELFAARLLGACDLVTAFGKPQDLARHAAQYAQLTLVEAGAAQDVAQRHHDV